MGEAGYARANVEALAKILYMYFQNNPNNRKEFFFLNSQSVMYHFRARITPPEIISHLFWMLKKALTDQSKGKSKSIPPHL